MAGASVTSAVNMTLFGHTENSQALEIEPFFSPLPLQKKRVSLTTQKLHLKQASSNIRLPSEPMNFDFQQCNKWEFSFVELKPVFFYGGCKIAGKLVRTRSCQLSDQRRTQHFNCKFKARLSLFKKALSFSDHSSKREDHAGRVEVVGGSTCTPQGPQ